MHMMKGNVGTGIMALPSAFNYSGLWVRVAAARPIRINANFTHVLHVTVCMPVAGKSRRGRRQGSQIPSTKSRQWHAQKLPKFVLACVLRRQQFSFKNKLKFTPPRVVTSKISLIGNMSFNLAILVWGGEEARLARQRWLGAVNSRRSW